MANMIDKDTRYFIDLDLKERKVIKWGHDNRRKLAARIFADPGLVRIFITKGQYNKLDMSK